MPNLSLITFDTLVISLLLIGLLFTFLKQPFVIAYLIAGMVIGPHGLMLISNTQLIQSIGELGVIILLFFVGMEICITRLLSNWRVSIIGTTLQIIISVAVVFGIGSFFNIGIAASILLGFVISLSSTALVVRLLEDRKEIETKTGRDVLGILIVQDLSVIPMLIILSLMAKDNMNLIRIGSQLFMGILIISFIIWLFHIRRWKFPFIKKIRSHQELQVFAALSICFGFALLTEIFGLSPALGAFIGGITVGIARETSWIQSSIKPIRIIFVALFFVSIGMLLDISYVLNNIALVFSLVLSVLILNTLINSVIFRMLGGQLRRSLYGGSLLSQLGEFSFVLGAAGLTLGIIDNNIYQLTLAVITLSLMISPFWIQLFGKIACKKNVCFAP
ncbi:MAG: cation:proton antiporter [Nanoarchaeota archaeon]|nr:cation:proton antiporter [Nanoarchaeota archaeon]MBU1004423.1 cation:proton antiporter [Nanoarchaeota archaeon]MBU1946690.1 cation:proton antiporter [Nanoarchaeota archaeon]